MVKLKSATMYYNDKEIEMKEANSECCVQLYFEILGNKYELDYFNADIDDITKAMNVEYCVVENKYTLVNYEYKLVFEVDVEIDGVHNIEEFVLETKDVEGVSVCKSTLLGTIHEIDVDIEEAYKELQPIIYMSIGNCFQF